MARNEMIIRVIEIAGAVAGILGVGLISILSRLGKLIPDPWQAAALALGLLLAMSMTFIIFERLVHRTQVKPELAEELTGRQVLVERLIRGLNEANEEYSYMAGDFSSVGEIAHAIRGARDRGVTIRILAPRPTVPAVRANLERAISLGCRVSVFHERPRRTRVAIIDANTPNADGLVIFIRRSNKHRKTTSRQAAGREDASTGKPEYVGVVYSDPMLVRTVGEWFDRLLKEEAEPFDISSAE